jgi:dihydroflavonol-4-reductase
VKVLLTGASGFIGAHVASELQRSGATVRGFCRTEPPLEDWVRGDVTDADAVRRACGGCDTVVHTAALYSYSQADAPRMEAVNVEGTRNVLDAAAQTGIGRVLVTSSSATCGPVPGRPATEHDAPPAWELKVPYKRTKLAAERLAVDAGAICVNPTTVVGPGDFKPTPSGRMVRDLVQGRIGAAYMRGAGINAVSVEDVARGHTLVLERGRPRERYILGGQDISLRDAFAIVLEAVGRKPPRIAIPWSVVYAAALAANALGLEPSVLVLDEVRLARVPLFFSSEKARSELGYDPSIAADALASAARWFHGRLATFTTSLAASSC